MNDDCGDRLDKPQVLLEVQQDGKWIPIRIADGYPDMRAAINALPMFARQQKVTVDDVRAKRLKTHSDVQLAKEAILRAGHQPSA